MIFKVHGKRVPYLLDQLELERQSSEVWYATKTFTNVFGTPAYIAAAAGQVARETNDLASTSAIAAAMQARADNLSERILAGAIRNVRCLFWEEDEYKAERIETARRLCAGDHGCTLLEVRFLEREQADRMRRLYGAGTKHMPNFALLVGGMEAAFDVAICHASQATDPAATGGTICQDDRISKPTGLAAPEESNQQQHEDVVRRLLLFQKAWQLGVRVL